MNAKINSFLGLATSLANPTIGTAKAVSNFIRHKVRGWLQLGNGYAKKFPTTGGTTDYGLPQITDASGDNYLKPAIYGISNLAWKDIHNFYVPNYGGNNITVAIGTYIKTGFDATTVNRFGVWVRPYWTGFVWETTKWLELTEEFVFGGGGIVFNAGTKQSLLSQGQCTTADPTGIVFNTSYFNGWTMVVGNSSLEDDNYNRVTATGFGYNGVDNQFYVQIASGTINNTSGGQVRLYRNFTFKDIPASISSYIFSIFNEIRLTSGNTISDVSLRAAFCSLAVVPGITTLDRMVLECAAHDFWRYAAMVRITYTAGTPEVPTRAYYYKFSILLGDQGETELKNCLTHNGAYQSGDVPFLFAVPAGNILGAEVYISDAGLLKRITGIRIYQSPDNNLYYVLKDILTTGLSLSVAARFSFNDDTGTTVNHFYAKYTAVVINGNDFAVLGSEATTDLGRAISEKGIIRWKTGTVIGKITYVGNTLSAVVGARTRSNQVMACNMDGDGVYGIDVFPSDGAHIIDVEYSDGDEIVALAPLVERIMCLKKKSIVLLSPDGQGGYIRELVSRQVGCASQNTVAAFDDVIYWADYTGVYSYDTRGLTLLNLSWLQDWKLILSTTKEAMFAEIDKTNKQYILFSGTTVYRYDLIDQEWMTDIFPITGIAAAADIAVDGTVDFLTSTKLETINRVTPSAAVDYDGAGYTPSWESNKIYPLREGDGSAANVLLKGISIEYSSTVAISVDLYLDDGATVQTTALAANKTFATIYAPLSSTCKAYRLKFTVTVPVGGLATTFAIKSVTHYFDIMPTGGDVITQ